MARAKNGDKSGSVTVKADKAAATPATKARLPGAFEEMDLLFDRLSRGLMSRMGLPALGETGWPFQAMAPKVDMVDRGKDILIRAEIPGVAKDDLHITLTDSTVTIRGETHKESKSEKGDYFRREISRGTFQRSLALPVAVAGDSAKASFKDGVLELVLAKVDKPNGRTIKVE